VIRSPYQEMVPYDHAAAIAAAGESVDFRPMLVASAFGELVRALIETDCDLEAMRGAS
jgi:hypothetical protein